MRIRAPSHPSPISDMRCIYNTGCGKRKRSDAKGITTTAPRAAPVEDIRSKLHKLRNQQEKHPWRSHQSVEHKELGCWKWDMCPAKRSLDTKRDRLKATCMNCEECTAEFEKVMYFCNNRLIKYPPSVTSSITINSTTKSTWSSRAVQWFCFFAHRRHDCAH